MAGMASFVPSRIRPPTPIEPGDRPDGTRSFIIGNTYECKQIQNPMLSFARVAKDAYSHLLARRDRHVTSHDGSQPSTVRVEWTCRLGPVHRCVFRQANCQRIQTARLYN